MNGKKQPLYPKTILWRHRKENLKKCSLQGLQGREDCLFVTYPTEEMPCLEGYLLLTLDAPLLTEEDARRGVLLVDATWRYAEVMLKKVEKEHGQLIKRSLPAHCRTAYPRYQTHCSDPERGLASIEALYLTYRLLGRETEGLLDRYHWKELFLHLNAAIDFKR